MKCRACAIPMVPHHHQAVEGMRQHVGRGLCSVCYQYLRSRRRLDQYPPLVRWYE